MRAVARRRFAAMEAAAPVSGHGDLPALADLPGRKFLVTSDFRLQESKIRAPDLRLPRPLAFRAEPDRGPPRGMTAAHGNPLPHRIPCEPSPSSQQRTDDVKASSLALVLAACLPCAAEAPRFDLARTLPERTENLVFRDQVRPHWLPGGSSFWYRVRTGPDTHEFVLVDAATGDRVAAPDLAGLGLAEALAIKTSESRGRLRRSRTTGPSTSLKFANRTDADVDLFWVDTTGNHVPYGTVPAGADREQHTYAGHVWLLASRTGERLAVVEGEDEPRTVLIDGRGEVREPQGRGPDRPAGPRGASPDGRWSASIEDDRVMLRDATTGETRHLATDLDARPSFRGDVQWSPDSSAFVVTHCPPVERRKVTIVESSPSSQSQPVLRTFDYSKPGDELPKPAPVIFRPGADPEWLAVSDALFPNPFTESDVLPVRWSPDSREFVFDYNQRGHGLYRLVAVDARSGAARVVAEESATTFVDYQKLGWRHWLDRSGELLWRSERDGWCHIWHHDAATGGVKNQVTHGPWTVRDVLHVDEDKRELWFLASGLVPDQDPYCEHLCRVRFAGTGLTRLTEADGDHEIDFSPDRRFFVDRWSRVDHPPVHELRRTEDGGLVTVLEQADASQLLAAGWTMPERFAAKGRDGATDIFGILIKPSHFDPAKKYPVVEEVYAGPQSAYVPKSFDRLVRQHTLAELGFIVVQADGMGTNHRGKAFHDVCWKNLKDAGFPDRIAWIKAAAASRPWMDLDRVGIYGGSAGGQNAMRALLDHHDFYSVAVADCGCHDNRMDKIWWNEQWMGWPVDESYARSSNADDAPKLEGRLLLIVGELDQNVDPASTTRVVGALQRANKTFDFLPIVGAGHGAAETPFGSRARMEFLARHLLDDPTPRRPTAEAGG